MTRSQNSWILIGFGVGVVAGLAANALVPDAGLAWFLHNISDPVGQLFLRLLLMVVVPLVFATVTTGVASLGGLGAAGRLSAKVVALYLGFAWSGAVIGVVVATLIGPGRGMSPSTRSALAQAYGSGAVAPARLGGETLVGLIPTNVVDSAARGDMLPVVIFAVVLGAALATLRGELAEPVLGFLKALGDVAGSLVGGAMSLAPIGVAALAFTGFARFGIGLLMPLGWFVVTVLACLTIYQAGLYPLLVRWLSSWSPYRFLQAVFPATLTGFVTQSSNATLPTSLRVARERLRAPGTVAGFVIPLGASLSRAGTSTFTAAAAIFLAQALGIETSLVGVLTVIGLATLTAVAAGGVPSGVFPLLATVLSGVGVPGTAIAIILGVEPILGMARTAINVTGGLVATVAVSPPE